MDARRCSCRSDFYGVVLDCNSNACVQAMAGMGRVERSALHRVDRRRARADLWRRHGRSAEVVRVRPHRHTLSLHPAPGTRRRRDGRSPHRSGSLWPEDVGLRDPRRHHRGHDHGTQRGYLNNDNMNFYVTLAGRNVVLGTQTALPGGGCVASGEWIDIIHGTDWLKTRDSEGRCGAHPERWQAAIRSGRHRRDWRLHPQPAEARRGFDDQFLVADSSAVTRARTRRRGERRPAGADSERRERERRIRERDSQDLSQRTSPTEAGDHDGF